MRVPDQITAGVRSGKSLGLAVDSEGNVTDWHIRAVDPPFFHPLGFLPLELLNEYSYDGDGYGFYWPITREMGAPISCGFYHGGGDLFPIATSLERFLRLEYACHWEDPYPPDEDEDDPLETEDDQIIGVASEWGVSLDGITRLSVIGGGIPVFGVRSVFDLLPYDPQSPGLLFLAAEECLKAGNTSDAIKYARGALEIIPEYACAWFQVAQAQRQRRETKPAIDAMLECFLSPGCLSESSNRERCLAWLKRYRDAEYPECADPLWLNRQRISFVTGVKHNDDFLLYEEMAEAYHQLGWGVKAVLFRQFIGEMMQRETTAFQERYSWSREGHLRQLRADLQRAGLTERLAGLPLA